MFRITGVCVQYCLTTPTYHTLFRFHSKLVSVAGSNKRKMVLYSGRGRPPKQALGAVNVKNSQEVCVCVLYLHVCKCVCVERTFYWFMWIRFVVTGSEARGCIGGNTTGAV